MRFFRTLCVIAIIASFLSANVFAKNLFSGYRKSKKPYNLQARCKQEKESLSKSFKKIIKIKTRGFLNGTLLVLATSATTAIITNNVGSISGAYGNKLVNTMDIPVPWKEVNEIPSVIIIPRGTVFHIGNFFSLFINNAIESTSYYAARGFLIRSALIFLTYSEDVFIEDFNTTLDLIPDLQYVLSKNKLSVTIVYKNINVTVTSIDPEHFKWKDNNKDIGGKITVRR